MRVQGRLGITRYTLAMKVAVSIPDDLYAEADRVAEQRGVNRSALYTRALRRLLADEEGDVVTRMIDATCDDGDPADLAGVARADLIDSGSWEW
jgi:predicted transcriptional regulator